MFHSIVPPRGTIHVAKNVDFQAILPEIGVGSYPAKNHLFGIGKNYSNLDAIIKTLKTSFKTVLIVDLVAEKDPYDTSAYPNVEYLKIRWIDYHALAFSDFINVIYKVVKFIKENESAVFIHCKHGKGRTGTLTCGLIMFLHQQTVQDANKVFTERRIIYKDGVQCKPQLELLEYWWYILNDLSIRDKYLQLRFERSTKAWFISEFQINDEKNKYYKNFEVRLTNIKEKSQDKHLKFRKLGEFDTNTTYHLNQVIQENICVEIEHSKRILKKAFVTFSFNVAMEWIKNDVDIHGPMKVHLLWDQMCGIKGTQFKGKKYFDEIVVKIGRKPW